MARRRSQLGLTTEEHRRSADYYGYHARISLAKALKAAMDGDCDRAPDLLAQGVMFAARSDENERSAKGLTYRNAYERYGEESYSRMETEALITTRNVINLCRKKRR